MPDRSDLFTAPARRALALADDEARRLNHNFVGTQHLLLGILREGSGVGALALASVGVELDRVRAAVDFLVGRGDRPVAGELEPAPPARKALAFAAEEARRLGRRRIGTHHLLLGLLRDDVGFTAATLRLLAVNNDHLRAEALRLALRASEPSDPVAGDRATAAQRRSGSAEELEAAAAIRVTLQVGKPLSRGLAEALDRAAGEADRLGHRRAQPAHVLLALIEREGALRRALRAGGGETKAVRAALRDHAAGRDRLTRELDAVQGARDAAEEAGGEDARKALHDRECNLIERLQRLDKG